MTNPLPIYNPTIGPALGQAKRSLNPKIRQLEGHDDGQENRCQQGLALAYLVKESRLGYVVPSQSGTGTYTVSGDNDLRCTCPDFKKRQQPCKHVYAVKAFVMQRGTRPDRVGAKRLTYRQDWAAYNAAQMHEQEHFVTLLRELCDTVPQPPQCRTGRPRLPLADVVFGIGLKVYSTMSCRRAMTDFRDAKAKGMLDRVPSFASTSRYLEDPALSPILKGLIEQSALPLRSVERDFAVDSSGFSSSVYRRWYDYKWGRVMKDCQWVKTHIMCGVTTNIVTAVEVTATDSSDAPHLAPFVRTTAKHFNVREVSGDKAYLSRNNLQAVADVGGTPYIHFKENSVARPRKRHELWEKAYHFYNFHRAEFLDHYHKRSNVESTFSMIKAKFGPAVRTKNPSAQVNEVLAKILCHNICVLIQSAYELGIEPIFDTSQTSGPS